MQSRDGLQLPKSVKTATQSYQNDSDKIRCFAADCLIRDTYGEEKTADVYSRYQDWCGENGYFAEGMRTFKQSLLTFADIKKKRPNTGGTATTMLVGYKLVSEFLDA